MNLARLIYMTLTPHIDDEGALTAFQEFRAELRRDPESAAVLGHYLTMHDTAGEAAMEPWISGEWEAISCVVDSEGLEEEPQPHDVTTDELQFAFPEPKPLFRIPSAAPVPVGQPTTPKFMSGTVWDRAQVARMRFGKYGPKRLGGPMTLYEVFQEDPGYLEWVLENVEHLRPMEREVMEGMLDAEDKDEHALTT